MTQEALRMAHKALIGLSIKHGEMTDEGMDAIAAIKEALAKEKTLQALHSENERLGLYKDAYAEPEQEPVTWGVDWGKAGDISCVSIIKRLPNGGIEVMAVEYAPYSYTTPPQLEERNFCSRCGKRLGGINSIHTCTPPMENTHDTRG
jgi:hypothetical protein